MEKVIRHPFAIAFLWAALFLITLHPATGALGGLIFLCIGPIAPTVVNFALAWGCASLFPAARIWKILFGIIVAFVLAIIPIIPGLYARALLPPTSSYEVRQKQSLSADVILNLQPKYDPGEKWWLPQPAAYETPMLLRWSVGANEGFGMFYERANAGLYESIAAALLAKQGRNTKPVLPTSPQSMTGIWFKYDVQKNTNGRYNFMLKVMNKNDITATFTQNNIPENFIEFGWRGSTASIKDQFGWRAFSMLVSNNVPAKIIAPYVPSIFPYAAFDEFLRAAIEWPTSTGSQQ